MSQLRAQAPINQRDSAVVEPSADDDAPAPGAGPADSRTRLIAALRRFWFGVSTVGRFLGYVAEFVGLTGLGLGILMQLINLVMRDTGLAGKVPLWLNDASTVALVGGAFVYCAATDRHIGFGGLVDLIKNKRAKTAVNTFTRIVVVICLSLLTYSGIETVKAQLQVGGNFSDDLAVPLWVFYAIAPFTLGMCAIRWLTVRGSSKMTNEYSEFDDENVDDEKDLLEPTGPVDPSAK